MNKHVERAEKLAHEALEIDPDCRYAKYLLELIETGGTLEWPEPEIYIDKNGVKWIG
ncbi:MAG: hypothetical protein RTU92_04270 [Candidatus Thorarchaeota archaeon]